MQLEFLEGEGWFYSRDDGAFLETSQAFPNRKAALAAEAAGSLVFTDCELDEGEFEQIVSSVLASFEQDRSRMN